MNPFFKAIEEVGAMSVLKREVDWVGTIIQITSVVAIGFALNGWAALFVACIWMIVNHWKNGATDG